MVDTSLVGCVLNGLSLMSGVTSKLEFAVNLYKGLAGNINESSRDGLAKEIFSSIGQSAPSGKKSLSIFYITPQVIALTIGLKSTQIQTGIASVAFGMSSKF